jgi:hypothetical protein
MVVIFMVRADMKGTMSMDQDFIRVAAGRAEEQDGMKTKIMIVEEAAVVMEAGVLQEMEVAVEGRPSQDHQDAAALAEEVSVLCRVKR